MLPKSDQQQIYLWMDLTRDTNVERSKEVVRGVNEFLRKYLEVSENIERYGLNFFNYFFTSLSMVL